MKRLQLIFLFFLSLCVQLAAQESRFDAELAQYVQFTPNGPNHIGRIVIEGQGGISQATWIYVNAALTEYKKTKPSCIILELNTPGGEVYAAQRISDALKDIDTQFGIPVIAYINNWAISAGAMLAYSCRFIVIAKDASMGAAEPVTFGEAGKMEEAPEKVNSALRTDFANRASFFGRDPDIAEAMVDKDVILVERKGEIIRLQTEDQIKSSDTIISAKGKLLTLNAEQLIEFGVADKMLVPMKQQLVAEDELASHSIPLSKTVFSQINFFQKLAPCTIDTFTMDWQTSFMAFLSTPAIASLLFLGMIVGFYLEMNTPGFGVAGVIGILCLFFIILSSFALEAIHWLEPILLVFGVFLVGLEFFFFPTLGILGALGGIFIIVGLLGMMLPGIESVSFSGDTLNAAGQYVLERLAWLSLGLLVALAIIAILSRYIAPRFSPLQRIVLGDTQLLATGKHEMQVKEPTPRVDVRVGEIADVVITLRPAGKISVRGGLVDAISTGNFVDSGKQVRIMRIEGERIFVEELL